PRTDIYSLGAAFFALLTSRPPFPQVDSMEVLAAHCYDPVPDVRVLNPAIPEGCAAIIRRAMAKGRGERYPSASVMLAELEALRSQPSRATAPVAGARRRAAVSAPSLPTASLPGPVRALPRRREKRVVSWVGVGALFVVVWLLGGAVQCVLPTA